MEKEKTAAANKAAAGSGKKKAGAADLKKAKQAVKAKPKKEKKPKVIRDSFTLPEDDYARLSELKKACLKQGLHVKKSELVRAGLRLLGKLDSAQLRTEMAAVEQIKTGRPKSK